MYDFEEITFLVSLKRTSDAWSEIFDVSMYKELVLFLDITDQGAYTDETLDIEVYSYDPASGKYIKIDNFTQVTADKSGGFQDKKIISGGLGSKIKVKAVMAGTSTDYTFSIGGVAKRE